MKTKHEWERLGYRIKSGEKPTLKTWLIDEKQINLFVFSHDQVSEIKNNLKLKKIELYNIFCPYPHHQHIEFNLSTEKWKTIHRKLTITRFAKHMNDRCNAVGYRIRNQSEYTSYIQIDIDCKKLKSCKSLTDSMKICYKELCTTFSKHRHFVTNIDTSCTKGFHFIILLDQSMSAGHAIKLVEEKTSTLLCRSMIDIIGPNDKKQIRCPFYYLRSSVINNKLFIPTIEQIYDYICIYNKKETYDDKWINVCNWVSHSGTKTKKATAVSVSIPVAAPKFAVEPLSTPDKPVRGTGTFKGVYAQSLRSMFDRGETNMKGSSIETASFAYSSFPIHCYIRSSLSDLDIVNKIMSSAFVKRCFPELTAVEVRSDITFCRKEINTKMDVLWSELRHWCEKQLFYFETGEEPNDEVGDVEMFEKIKKDVSDYVLSCGMLDEYRVTMHESSACVAQLCGILAVSSSKGMRFGAAYVKTIILNNFCGKISVRNEKIGFLLTLLQDYGILVRTNRSYGNVGSSWSLGEAVSHLVTDSILVNN